MNYNPNKISQIHSRLKLKIYSFREIFKIAFQKKKILNSRISRAAEIRQIACIPEKSVEADQKSDCLHIAFVRFTHLARSPSLLETMSSPDIAGILDSSKELDRLRKEQEDVLIEINKMHKKLISCESSASLELLFAFR